MKPIIDTKKCVGCGTCEALCPGVFKVDEDGMAKVTDPKGCDEGKCDCQAAKDSCPEGAISLK
ncbi:MAG: ferredoxin [Patescibacteria group bacterium]